jgi:peptide/nickel transport system substrate-binding protein
MAPQRDVHELLEDISSSTLDRRSLIRRAALLGLSVPALAGLLAACGDDDDDEPTTAPAEPTAPPAAGDDDDEEEPEETPEEEPDDEPEETPEEEDDDDAPAGEGQYGGRLRIALIGEPPTLDVHQTTATIVAMITWHMYEAIFTWDEEFAIVPLLAESYEVSGDGLTNTVTLRQGVMFHNGDEMTSVDVVASIERWAEISGLGAGLMAATDNINVVDDYTIEFNMSETLGSFSVLLARQNQGCAIYPESIVDAAGTEALTEFIGTGPYRFADRQADRFILMERFEDYVGQDFATNGYSGTKHAYLDELEFLPVPDEAARIAGLQAGDYDYLESIVADQMSVLEDNPDIDVELLPPSGWDVLVFNTAQGILTDQKIREAIQATIDCDPVMIAAEGEGFYRLDPGFMLQETVWHSEIGGDRYNMGDPELGRQLLEESSYDGEPIRFLTTQEYADQYATAVVSRQQLEEIGMNIELIVTDWATLIANRAIEDQWEIFTTGFSFRVDPVGMPPISGCSWPGWWCTDGKVEAVERLQGETDFEARYQALEDVQELWYTDVPGIKLADTYGISARSSRIQNFVTLTQLQPEFANIWLED